MFTQIKKYNLSISVFFFVAFLLAMVQLKVERPMLLAERFITGAGWIEIFLIALYGAFIAHKMLDVKNINKWRIRIWTLFSIVFFSQLLLGILGIEKCLMKQDISTLHFPIPTMILTGPVYRGKISFMTILFLSTIILSGPAWCSHLCYFGAMDGLAAQGKRPKGTLKHKWLIKSLGLLTIIAITLMLRFFKVPAIYAIVFASAFGMIGIGIIMFLTRNRKTMVHCIAYCPIGTVVSFLKYISPFRIKIQPSCTQCMACTPSCKYDALTPDDIKSLEPGRTCTYCGDCLSVCRSNAIVYSVGKLSPDTSRNIFLFITISLHAAFLALARI